MKTVALFGTALATLASSADPDIVPSRRLLGGDSFGQKGDNTFTNIVGGGPCGAGGASTCCPCEGLLAGFADKVTDQTRDGKKEVAMVYLQLMESMGCTEEAKAVQSLIPCGGDDRGERDGRPVRGGGDDVKE